MRWQCKKKLCLSGSDNRAKWNVIGPVRSARWYHLAAIISVFHWMNAAYSQPMHACIKKPIFQFADVCTMTSIGICNQTQSKTDRQQTTNTSIFCCIQMWVDKKSCACIQLFPHWARVRIDSLAFKHPVRQKARSAFRSDLITDAVTCLWEMAISLKPPHDFPTTNSNCRCSAFCANTKQQRPATNSIYISQWRPLFVHTAQRAYINNNSRIDLLIRHRLR